ncbi:MAG: hypothetical protein JWM96_721 [Alphaproteobacteria bacterium]|nr:hypothetical protein [Alphaproteobacteria bacterium]
MSAGFDHNLARNFDRAVIAKLTVKKILHQIDYIETMVTCGSEGGDMKIVLPDWFAECGSICAAWRSWPNNSRSNKTS